MKKRSISTSSTLPPSTTIPTTFSLNVQKKNDSFSLTLDISGFALNAKEITGSKQTRSQHFASSRQKNQPSKILRHIIHLLSITSKHPLIRFIGILLTILIITNLNNWFVTTQTAKMLGFRLTSDQLILLIDKFLDVILRY